MSYTPRTYNEIVRDLLTTMTGGTVAESLLAPAGDALVTPDKLRDRPVRRVSHVQGVVGTADNPVPFRFTNADYELISTTGDENDKDALRFRENGRRPIPGSTLTVNYYPVRTNPTPLNDLNVGSVVRTLLETVAFELAVTYGHLDSIYKSAFLETAEGSSLDKVVALVGVKRLPAAHPVVKVRFERRTRTPGRITIPTGTVVTDDKAQRYLTQEELILEPGESSRDVMAAGETPGTAEVEERKLDRMEVLVAGVEKAYNIEAARRLSQPETDQELRLRARGAFHGVIRGTLDALRFHLLSIPEVKAVSIVEEPNGIPGEVRLDVAYFEDTPEARQKVDDRIKQVRPAGIRIVSTSASSVEVSVRVELTLTGTGVSGSELAALKAELGPRLVDALNATPPGGTVRRSRLISIALQDERIVDATITLIPAGGSETTELTLPTGEVLTTVTPIQFATPKTEEVVSRTVDVIVSATLPVHLTPGTTQAEVSQAINNAFAGHLSTRTAELPLTLDSVAAAIRDDTRFALIRTDATVVVEAVDRFFQLTDGIGSYAPAPNERLGQGTVAIDVREGGV